MFLILEIRKLLLTILMTIPMLANAQIDLSRASWRNLPCDTLQTQLEANVCSGKKFRMADSSMNIIYDKFREYLQNQINQESEKAGSVKYDAARIQSLARRISFLKESQLEFEAYKKSMQNFVFERYSNGSQREESIQTPLPESVRPMMVNQCGLKLTEDRILALYALIHEF